MKNKILGMKEKLLLKKRFIVETVIDLLKNHNDLWHTRHRSVDNGFNNMLAALAAYNFRELKPSINTSKRDFYLALAAQNPSN